MFCSLAAHAAQQVAAQMEELGMAHQRAALTFARLEHEVRMLKTDLLNMLRHGKVAAASSARTRHVIARETRLLHPARQGKPRRAWQGLPRFAVRQHERNFAGQSLGLHKGAVR
jgi:hypothetical protein